ncbi:hypothetical protein EDC04DRAFT_1392555 [Pisolithus marmoratus]|nr:hypothetical protein EDC04DRAFT_1392555 [Pisolithus marmoratus]
MRCAIQRSCMIRIFPKKIPRINVCSRTPVLRIQETTRQYTWSMEYLVEMQISNCIYHYLLRLFWRQLTIHLLENPWNMVWSAWTEALWRCIPSKRALRNRYLVAMQGKVTELLTVSEGTTKPSGVSFNADEREQLPVTPPPLPQVSEKPVPSITAIGGLGVGLGIIPHQLGQSSPQIVVSDYNAVRTPAPKKSRSTNQQQSGEPTSVRDGLRLVVLARLRCDRQTRDERIYPLLRANQVVSELQRVPGILRRPKPSV